MARPPRIATPGGIYHITARGNRRQAIFTTDDEIRFAIEQIAEILESGAYERHLGAVARH